MVGNMDQAYHLPDLFRNLDKISLIESKLSEFTGKEKSLIFSGGFDEFHINSYFDRK